MRRIVVNDFELIFGGPMGGEETLAVFGKGEELTIRRVSTRGEYPKMYKISEYPQLGAISRGILTKFLRGFQKRRKKKEL